MAKGKYQKLYEARQKRLGKSSSDEDSLQRQINNTKARLEAGGVENPNNDSRNALEKFLNLEKDQNFIFDIFEILERPQQAIFTGIKNAQEGESALKGAWEGLSGQKDTEFKEILMNTGVFEDEEGKIDLVDILGTAGDVFLDPMNIPVGGFNKVGKALDAGESVFKALRNLDTVDDVLFKAAGKGIKTGAKIADTGIEKGLKYLDEVKGIIYKNADAKWASELGRIGSESGKLEKYKGLKNSLTTMFNTKLSATARKSKKVNDAIEANVKTFLKGKADKLDDLVKKTAVKLGKNADDVARDIQKVTDIVDKLSISDIIDGARNGTVKYSDDVVNALSIVADDMPQYRDLLKKGITKGKDGSLELSAEWFKNIDNFDPEKLANLKVNRASWLSDAELKEIEDLTKYYNENAPELVEAFNNFYTEANDYISKSFSSMNTLGDKFNLKNVEGYAKHKMSDNYVNNLKKLVTDYGVNPSLLDDQVLKEGLSGVGSKTLNSRKYNMSAAEANILKKKELMSIPGLSKEAKSFIEKEVELFDTMATAGVQEYINNMPKYAKNTQMIDEVLLKQGFGDIAEISRLNDIVKNATGNKKAKAQSKLNKLLDNSPFRVVENGKSPYGFKKIDGETKEYLVNFLKSTGNKTGNSSLVEMSNQLKNLDNMAVDPTVLNIIKVSTDGAKKNEFLKMYDGLLNLFKGTKTFSLTNQMNNITGNISNMMLSGMSGTDIADYVGKAFSDIYGKGGYEEILKRGLSDAGQLTGEEAKVFKRLQQFQSNVSLLDEASLAEKYDIGEIASKIKGDTTGEKAKYILGSMARLNGAEDRIFKYALFLKGMDDPQFLANLGVKVNKNMSAAKRASAAAEAVSKVLFDPRDLTNFENKVMKRIIPFYTFAKKNLAFQIDNIGKNGGNYAKLMRAYNSLNSNYGDDYENMPDFLKENMYIPIPTVDKDGNYKFIRAQLPFGDFVSTVTDPIGTFVNNTTPAIKVPYELATGVDTFTGRNIEDFPGQKSTQIPFLPKKVENILSDTTGFDVPYKTISNLLTNPADVFTISRNVDTDKINKQYEELNDLQNLMKQYEQEGYEFSTMTELKKANKNTVVGKYDALFAKYGIK